MIVERAPVADEYTEDGETVVLLADGRVIALSVLASSVLRELADDPRDVEALARALVDEFGAPPSDPEAVDTTGRVLDELIDLRVVSRRGQGQTG